jgi:hypothetical protein
VVDPLGGDDSWRSDLGRCKLYPGNVSRISAPRSGLQRGDLSGLELHRHRQRHNGLVQIMSSKDQIVTPFFKIWGLNVKCWACNVI